MISDKSHFEPYDEFREYIERTDQQIHDLQRQVKLLLEVTTMLGNIANQKLSE